MYRTSANLFTRLKLLTDIDMLDTVPVVSRTASMLLGLDNKIPFRDGITVISCIGP